MTHILAIDQGTTSSRAIVFDERMAVVATAAGGVPAAFPAVGLGRARPGRPLVLDRRGLPRRDRAGGARARRDRGDRHHQPARDHAGLGPGDRRAARAGDRLAGPPHQRALRRAARRRARADGHRAHRPAARPLLLRHQAQVAARRPPGRARAGARGASCCSAPSTRWLIWKLTGGRVHATDATNAARTLLYNIRAGGWDADICALLDVPMAMLPAVRDSAADFGEARADLFGRAVPILGVAGDQQAATVGQACFEPGMLKATYGTGCFAVLNTGDDPGREPQPAADHHRLPARRPADLRARRLDLHRRRGGAVAARRAEDHPPRLRDPRPRRGRRPGPAALPGAGLHRPRRALLGPRLPAARSSASPATPARPSSPAPRSRASPTRPATSSRRCAPTGRRRATPCSASTAA